MLYVLLYVITSSLPNDDVFVTELWLIEIGQIF